MTLLLEAATATQGTPHWSHSLFTTGAAHSIWAPAPRNTPSPVNYLRYDALEQLEAADETLRLHVCKHGERCYNRHRHCRALHTLDDILEAFRRPELLALYKSGGIKKTACAPPRVWETRPSEQFQCTHTVHCVLTPQEYTLRLMHDSGNLLKYPVCRVFCAHCRRTRSIPVYT